MQQKPKRTVFATGRERKSPCKHCLGVLHSYHHIRSPHHHRASSRGVPVAKWRRELLAGGHGSKEASDRKAAGPSLQRQTFGPSSQQRWGHGWGRGRGNIP